MSNVRRQVSLEIPFLTCFFLTKLCSYSVFFFAHFSASSFFVLRLLIPILLHLKQKSCAALSSNIIIFIESKNNGGSYNRGYITLFSSQWRKTLRGLSLCVNAIWYSLFSFGNIIKLQQNIFYGGLTFASF